MSLRDKLFGGKAKQRQAEEPEAREKNCDQERGIGQLKGGGQAVEKPGDELPQRMKAVDREVQQRRAQKHGECQTHARAVTRRPRRVSNARGCERGPLHADTPGMRVPHGRHGVSVTG